MIMLSKSSSVFRFKAALISSLLCLPLTLTLNQHVYADGLLKVIEDPAGKVEYSAKTLD